MLPNWRDKAHFLSSSVPQNCAAPRPTMVDDVRRNDVTLAEPTSHLFALSSYAGRFPDF
jgi:hypothetical protein